MDMWVWTENRIMYTSKRSTCLNCLYFVQLGVFMYPNRHCTARPTGGTGAVASLACDNQDTPQRHHITVLQFLDFDRTEDTQGISAWDAMACPAPQHTSALLAEAAALLHRLHLAHGQPGPLDEQHAWDCDLHIAGDDGTVLAWQWHGQTPAWTETCTRMADTRFTVSLSLTGDAAFRHTLEQETSGQ